MTDLQSIQLLRKKEEHLWPSELREAAEIAKLTFQTMEKVTFAQSAGLQAQAARALSDFDQKYRAWKA